MIKKKKKKLGKKRKKLLNEWLLLWYISRKFPEKFLSNFPSAVVAVSE